MGWLNFGGKKRTQGQGFGKSQQRKSRKSRRTFVLEKIVTPSAGVGGWLQDFDSLHQLLGAFSLSDLDLPNFLADSGVCPIAPGAPTNNLPPLIDFDPLGLYHDGIATQTPYNPGGAFETLPVALIPVDPHSPNPSNPNAIRQLLDFPLASQPLLGSIDTGVSADSPYLNYANIKKGRDYVGGDDNPLLKPGEGSEHGTFMLGIVDAINKTAPKWVGRAIDSGRWADSLVEFVDAAKASGQKNAIANLSLDLTQKNADGSVTTRYELTTAERSAIEYARQNGVMLVVAAGNDGGVMSVLGQASQEFDNIFTVGAGDINGRSIYSSYGRGLDILADGGTTEHPGLSTVGDDLGTMAGTSVATAKVAGAASLVWAANPALNYRQVMEILKSTARDLGPVGWDDETGFGFLNTLAAVDLAKKTQPEVYKPTAWVTPDTWSGQGKVTPEERAAKGGNSLAAATVQVSTNFSDSDRVDSNQPEKYYQFTVTEPGYVSWNLTTLNPVSGFPTPPQVTVTKADGKPGSYTFLKGASLQTSVVGEGQTSFQGGNFYDPGTYYLKVVGGAWSSFKDYNISTQFIADRVSTFTGNIQYRTQPYYSLENSLQSAVFSGPTVSDLNNLSGVVTYNNVINFNNRIAKYGVEVNESGKIRINLNSPNGKMEVSIKKFIGSDDRPESIASLEVAANSDQWLELDLNKGRYDIEVKTPSNYWLEPDWNSTWNSTEKTLVRPYTLNATFAPNAPQPGQGQVPSSAGAFDKTVVSNGVVNHYYKNGYLTVQPSGQASWYSYGTGNAIGAIEISAVPLPFEIPPDYAGNSPNTARDIGTLIGTQTFHDVIDRNDRFDYYKFNITSESKVDFALSGKMGNTGFYLFQDWYFNSDDSTHIDRISGTPPGVVPEFSETLKPGTYYVLVHKPKDYDGDEYDLKLSATPLGDPDGNYSIQTAQELSYSPADFGDGVERRGALGSIGGSNLNDFYKFSLNSLKLVNFQLSQLSNAAKLELIQDLNGNGQVDWGEAITTGITGSTPRSPLSFDRILEAGNYYLRVSPGSGATGATKYQVDVALHSPENQVIAGYNSDYYLVQNGQLRLVPDQETLNGLGINLNTVKRFSNGDLARIPLGQPLSPLTPQWQKSIDDAANQNSLGNPVTSYWDAADSPTGTKGYGRTYDRGSVYWTAKSGAIALVGSFADAYHNPNGGSNGWLGFPTAKQWNWEGGQRIDFEGGYIYRTAKEGIRAFKYDESPWQKSIDAEYARYQDSLGSPKGGYWDAADSPTGTKGHGQNYNNGHVFWTAKYGAIALPSPFANTYNQTGGSNNWLGFPTKGQEPWKDGQRIEFEGGYIYWTAQSGAKAYPPNESPSLDKTVGYDGANTHPTYVNTFNNNGGSSALGSPTGNVYRSVDNGYLQEFSGGSKGSGAIMKSGANNNSYWVGGDFWARYQEAVSQGKNLGYPTSDRFVDQNGLQTQTFQKGKIVYDAGVYKVFLSSSDSGSNNSGGGSGNYYPQLASLTDGQWDEYSGDNTRFDNNWPDYRDDSYLTPEQFRQPIKNIYTELSTAIFGSRYPMSAGYLHDPGYYNGGLGPQGINVWHPGIDIMGTGGKEIKALVGGTVTYINVTGKPNGYITAIKADDGNLWLYTHINTAVTPGKRIEAGDKVGYVTQADAHLHLEVQKGSQYQPTYTNGGDKNFVANATISPLQAYWQWKNKNSAPFLDNTGDAEIDDPKSSGGQFKTDISINNGEYKAQLKEILTPSYYGKSYKPFIEAAANKYDWLTSSVLAGIGSRETDWGLSSYLNVLGPTGTGDWARRKGKLPPDGLGFGRGLMQIDYDAHEFARTGNWGDPRENILYAASVLASSRNYIQQNTNLQGNDLLRAAIAGYNAGPGNVLKAINQGLDIDYYTTGRDYSRNVLNRAGWFQLNGWT
ncbi:S8 family serine peptidase [Microcoleus sp. herbarium7]|uniref:S8 family serine peptidase n=1 Tax=Microcoleus sp. herbarium7 TaxID=3055435 RepID=UPI002FD71265